MLFNLVSYLIMLTEVQKTVSKFSKSQSGRKSSLLRLRLYPIILYLVWTIPSCARIYYSIAKINNQKPLWLQIIETITMRYGGFWNLLIYITNKPVRVVLTNMCTKKVKKIRKKKKRKSTPYYRNEDLDDISELSGQTSDDISETSSTSTAVREIQLPTVQITVTGVTDIKQKNAV